MLFLKINLDIFALVTQLSGAFVWPILQWVMKSESDYEFHHSWSLPLGMILTSFGWWENFVSKPSSNPILDWMATVRTNMIQGTRYFIYLWISIWKTLLFFSGAWLVISLNGVLQNPMNLFHKFADSFDAHSYNITEDADFFDDEVNENVLYIRTNVVLTTIKNSPIWVLLIQICSSYLAYIFAKFASKVQIQRFSFALPLCSAIPIIATMLFSGKKYFTVAKLFPLLRSNPRLFSL